MQKLIIEFSKERLITPSGLSLVGQMLGKSNFIKKCNSMKVDGKRSQSQIKNGDILLSYIGLLCQGKTSYEDIREMSADPDYYKLALGITRTSPSAETLRQRMDDIGSSLREDRYRRGSIKSIIYTRYAKKADKEPVVHIDQMIRRIQEMDSEVMEAMSRKKMKDLADFYLGKNNPDRQRYEKEYNKYLEELELLKAAAVAVGAEKAKAEEKPLKKVKTEEELYLIPGFGAKRIQKYGEEILQMINIFWD